MEGEVLAVAEALHKLKYYVLGCPTLIVATNHKPLIRVFRSNFSKISNPCLLSIVERTLWFRFTVFHVSGVSNSGLDCLSHCKTGLSSSQHPLISESPILSCVMAAISHDEGLHAVTIQKVALFPFKSLWLASKMNRGATSSNVKWKYLDKSYGMMGLCPPWNRPSLVLDHNVF